MLASLTVYNPDLWLVWLIVWIAVGIVWLVKAIR